MSRDAGSVHSVIRSGLTWWLRVVWLNGWADGDFPMTVQRMRTVGRRWIGGSFAVSRLW